MHIYIYMYIYIYAYIYKSQWYGNFFHKDFFLTMFFLKCGKLQSLFCTLLHFHVGNNVFWCVRYEIRMWEITFLMCTLWNSHCLAESAPALCSNDYLRLIHRYTHAYCMHTCTWCVCILACSKIDKFCMDVKPNCRLQASKHTIEHHSRRQITCMYICMYVYIHTYIHTYLHRM
jgi:hypothetical protein